MMLVSKLRLITVTVLITLSSCSGQIKNNAASNLQRDSSISSIDTLGKTTEGIVYFSYDNGLTWELKSTGLPLTTSIGLGGIAVSKNNLGLLAKDNGLYLFNAQEDKWDHVPTDKQLLESNPGALIFHRDRIYAGTQTGGVFYSQDGGKNWTKLNAGLANLSIRKFAEIEHKLYAATNSGLYSYDEILGQWDLEHGTDALQVNGITALDGSIYIATNQGAFASPIGEKHWKKIFSNGALHNISSADKALYAMVYNELFLSLDQGNTWHNIQDGLPAQLYTFNVIKSGHSLLAGQWDGIYRKDIEREIWKFSSNGLPEHLAFTNMQVYYGIIVVSGGERGLRAGITTNK